MREADRRRACDALQDIETDLVFGLIEAYEDGRREAFADTLALLVDFKGFQQAICGQMGRNA